MKNILILGASSSLSELLKDENNSLKLFARRSQSVAKFAGERVNIMQGDVLVKANRSKGTAFPVNPLRI